MISSLWKINRPTVRQNGAWVYETSLTLISDYAKKWQWSSSDVRVRLPSSFFNIKTQICFSYRASSLMNFSVKVSWTPLECCFSRCLGPVLMPLRLQLLCMCLLLCLPHLKSISRLFNLILTNLFIPMNSIPKWWWPLLKRSVKKMIRSIWIYRQFSWWWRRLIKNGLSFFL